MQPRQYSFLVSVLGEDGARALKKAAERSDALGQALLPRAILSWLGLASRWDYEGGLPGVENTYVAFKKSEDERLSGSIALGGDVYDFEGASPYHVAATVGVVLGMDDSPLHPSVRDLDLARLGKSIDALVKYRAASQELAKRLLDPSEGYSITPGDQSDGITHIVAHDRDGNQVGVAKLQHLEDGTLQPFIVAVDDDHQRKGLASAMYAHAEKLTGKKIVPATHQTAEGAALWAGNSKQAQFGGTPPPKFQVPPASVKEKNNPVLDAAKQLLFKPKAMAKAEQRLAKMAVIHDGPNPATVYRMENAAGEGPYRGPDKIWARLPDKSQDATLPAPHFDFDPNEHEALYGGQVRFGFQSPEHAHQWFGQQNIDFLKQHGYTLKPVQAVKVWVGKSGRQVMYTPHAEVAKVELPGKSAEPKKQLEPLAPQAPVPTQQGQTRSKLPSMRITKSEADARCRMCGTKQFHGLEFKGCVCFRSMAKSVRATHTDQGVTLEFRDGEWDFEAMQALRAAMKGK